MSDIAKYDLELEMRLIENAKNMQDTMILAHRHDKDNCASETSLKHMCKSINSFSEILTEAFTE